MSLYLYKYSELIKGLQNNVYFFIEPGKLICNIPNTFLPTSVNAFFNVKSNYDNTCLNVETLFSIVEIYRHSNTTMDL